MRRKYEIDKVCGKRKALNNHSQRVQVGIFHCPKCNNDVQLSIMVRKNQSSCGCTGTIYRPKPAERRCLMWEEFHQPRAA